MPAVTSTSEEQDEANEQRMWDALKRYIIRERQRKKEEYEAEVEEERLRKEKEARERQDVMTLEETKEQIEQLETKLKTLEKEKQQLFMQLKKVLNEDEVRKRQQQKETNEMQPMKMPMGNIQIPMFPMSSSGQNEQSPSQGRSQPHDHMLNKTVVRGPIQSGVKRGRSPSPKYAVYAHRPHQPIKQHQPVYSDHKTEDGRMGRQMAHRAVLWNKAQPSQYGQNAGGSNVSYTSYHMNQPVVGVGERPPPLLYAPHHGHTPHTPHHGSLMYAPAQPNQLYIDMMKRDQHNDKKEQPQVLIGLSEAHHPSVSSTYAHIKNHAPQHNNMQQAKPGSITQGYPVQNNPNSNANIYTARHRY